MRDNILTTFLRLAGVKYTHSFSRQYFTEHPHKFNLFGLSSMLTDYGIENVGVKISDKNDIRSLDPPFIVHTGNDFAVVEKISNDNILFIERNRKIKITLGKFFEMWTGNTLIAETDKNSKEPDYEIHFREELFQNLRKIAILFILLFLFAFAFISYRSFAQMGVVLLLLINFAGVYIGYLLVLKQLHIQSDYADKICSLFKYNDCNNILDSDSAKFMGVIGWSEIGLGYFISNVIILSLLTSLIPCMLFINIFCLPYTFWSIWYQKFKAKQWCPMCLIVLLLLWGIFITGLLFDLINFNSITFWGIVITGGIYTVVILTISMLIPVISRSSKLESIQFEINSIKSDIDVFNILLKKQPFYKVNKNTSGILMGNSNSNMLITIFTNPHCNPCAKMHQRVNNLIYNKQDICVQYIFSSFDKELDVSNKYLIGVYQQRNGEKEQIFNEWFEKGKNNKDSFFTKFPINFNDKVENEFETHQKWKDYSGLRATPTILFNGYLIPDNYKLEDLSYFTKI